MNWIRILVLFGCLFPVVATADALSAIESLLMPGDVTLVHARYEKECKKCHVNFKRGGQNDLCLKCHEDVDKDIKNKEGYHSTIHNVKDRLCYNCHTEHRGREKDIAEFDKELFEHKNTDFELKGWHTQLECDTCHKPKSKFREAKSGCYDCHKDDDRHKGRLDKNCQNCHIEQSWSASRFDHSKTDFELKGEHKNVVCLDCHPNDRFANTPDKCFYCHELDDKHEDLHGRKCETCHEEKDWASLKFDHDKDTKFKLENMHSKLLCKDCHKENIYEKALKTNCYACHELHDDHNGRYGEDCKDCHDTKDWERPVFEHNEDTDFKLRGEHKKAKCDDCHRGMLFKDSVKGRCYFCHRFDDAHDGQQGKICQQCHDERGWEEKVTFDHDVTRFPLYGSHNIVSCEECHLSGAFKDTEKACMECHKEHDHHEQKLGIKCQMCHSPFGWLEWDWDHDKKTDFKLDGAHKGIDCHACHKKKVKEDVKVSMLCYSCHKDDDNHDGNLGTQCDKCHVTSSFKKRKLN